MAVGNLTPQQQAVLAAELQNDPQQRGYASMGEPNTRDGLVLADLEELRCPGEYRATILAIADECGTETASRMAASMQAAATVDPLMAEMLAVSRSGEGIDVNHTGSRAKLAEMAANPDLPLTAADADAITGLAANLASRLDVLGLPVPRIREIRQALES